MLFDEYQEKAADTAIYEGRGDIVGMIYNTLQICSEAGEIAGKLAKHLMKYGPTLPSLETMEAIDKECGDTLWHISQLLWEFGRQMSKTAEGNLTKLADRKERNVLHGNGDSR